MRQLAVGLIAALTVTALAVVGGLVALAERTALSTAQPELHA